jgi:hypothetical protein
MVKYIEEKILSRQYCGKMVKNNGFNMGWYIEQMDLLLFGLMAMNNGLIMVYNMTLKFEIVITDKPYYFRYGELHRTDRPAILYSNGEQHWYQYGKRHRNDDPAVIYADGNQYWYKNGRCYDP